MSIEKFEETTVEDDIAAAMQEIADKETPAIEEQAEDTVETQEQEPVEKPRAEDGKFTKQSKAPKEVPVIEAVEKSQAPQSWGAAVKSKWDALPPEVQAEISKREKDFHQAMTRNDGELSLGKEMKDVITPYMPIIQAEGGTPAKAVQSLLNTAYQLRTAPPERKAQLIHEIAQTYGVDLGQIQQVQQQTQLDPGMQQILSRINGIESKFTEYTTLQERQEHANVMEQISAFSADPSNVYFEQLKPSMAPLLASGQAKDLQEAYDMACWANPEIRSILLQKQQAEEAEKRKAEISKKKAAAVSVTGSPSVRTSSSTPNQNSVEDDIRQAMEEILDA